MIWTPTLELMKHFKTITTLTALAVVSLFVTGCASPNVNPPHARAKTGYVDFYADSSGELSWQVARFDDRTQDFRSVFSEFEPPPGRALRLAFPPGHYRLRVTFMNRVVREPGLVEVEVKDGMITTVRVQLTEAGETTVETKQTSVGGTAYGRYGRRTKFSNDEAATYRVSAEANEPMSYQVKERMPYAR
jgi:hypothetical protein